MIECKPFKQSKEEYFKLILKVQIKKKWWIILLVIILSIYNSLMNEGEPGYIIWIFAPVILILVYYIQIRRFAFSNKNKIFFTERKLFFNNKIMRFNLDSGIIDEVPYNNVIEVKSEEKYWMAYISKGQFIYIPKNIFYTNDDFEHFQEYLNR